MSKSTNKNEKIFPIFYFFTTKNRFPLFTLSIKLELARFRDKNFVKFPYLQRFLSCYKHFLIHFRGIILRTSNEIIPFHPIYQNPKTFTHA